MSLPVIDLIGDIIAVLDRDDAALADENTTLEVQITDLQNQIVALGAQLITNRAKQQDSARFRQLAADIQTGSVAASVVVPGAPPPTAAPEPITSGITTS